MASHCEICNKTKVVGRTISHASNKSAREFKPNLQRVRVILNGGTKRIKVCTVCIKSGKIQKAI
ncbi:MAG TPA: 50S ribosomal protein L28 [Nitrospiria bacterium]|nr:50S ribosomal protein L28 [Nitrospiria bacterium]